MKKKYMFVLLLTVSILAICLLFGEQNLNITSDFTSSNEENFNVADDDPINGSISFDLFNTTITFETNTSAEDPSKLSWGYYSLIIF